MYTEIIRISQLLTVIIIASQGIYFAIGGAETMKKLSIPVFADYRKTMDSVIAARLRVLYYIALILNIIILLLSRHNLSGSVFIFTIIATVCIIADIVLAVKDSIPINQQFNQYPAENISDWRSLQLSWVRIIVIRGVFSMSALGALLLSWLL